MTYEQPQVKDLGTLVDLTLAGVLGNAEDAGMKLSIQVKIPEDGDVVDVSIGVLP